MSSEAINERPAAGPDRARTGGATGGGEQDPGPGREARPGEDLADVLSEPWGHFVDLTAEHRPALFAFGRRLTGNPLDGEDLVQDAVIRAFGAAAVQHGGVGDLRSYLFRTMSNLWIDQQRRASSILMGEFEEQLTAMAGGVGGGAGVGEPTVERAAERAAELRAASERLFESLAPRERVAVVLHEGFGFTHAEIATMVATSEGAVRTALHRARKRLADEPDDRTGSPSAAAADRGVIDAFVSAFENGDVDAIRGLLLPDVRATVFPYPVGQGAEHAIAEGWIRGSLYHHDEAHLRSGTPYPSELRAMAVDGVPVVVVERAGEDGMLLEEVWRIAVEDGAIARIQDYCFSPDLVSHVGDVLELPVRRLGYHF